MEIYTLLRQFADSWGLVLLMLAFVGVVIFAFRPGSAGLHRDLASLPLRNDDKPLGKTHLGKTHLGKTHGQSTSKSLKKGRQA
jgi:cytochrome c oxidase cbb3-type subunit 4